MANEPSKTMAQFHCEMLELSIPLSAEGMDQDAFLEAAELDREEYTDEDGDFSAAVSFGGHEATTDYHVHMRIRFFKDGQSRIEISYHDSKAEAIEDVKPPYAEDCARWIGSFLKEDRVTARVKAGYTFDKSYSPVISLPFPLISTEKALAGSLITGLSILFPRDVTESAVIQSGSDDNTIIFFNTKSDLKLKEFDLFDQLGKLSGSVESLVKKKNTGNDN